MDNSKKASFVRMSRQHFSKGGMVRKLGNRKYFDTGGATTLGGPGGAGVQQNAVNPNTGILGTVTGALGLNNNFQASGANIQQGTNQAQLNQAYQGAQGALNAQQGLTNTISPEAQIGVNAQNQLANEYGQMAQGQGPNPALAQLAQATNQNVNQQAALQAGQRGASGNVGLMARQIGQQGAQTQQNAAGQAATLEAQQQIAAQQNLANLAANQINQAGTAVTGLNTAQQNEQSTLQNANTSANNAAVGMQSNINNTNAQTAAANQGVAGKIFGGIAGAGSAIGGAASSALSAVGLAHGGEIESPDHLKLAEMNATALAHGRKNYAPGGQIVGNPLLGNQTQNQSAPQSFAGQYTGNTSSAGPNIQSSSIQAPDFSDMQAGVTKGLNSLAPAVANPNLKQDPNSEAGDMVDQSAIDHAADAHGGIVHYAMGTPCVGPHQSHVMNFLYAQGGKVPSMVSPGEIYLSPEKVHKVIQEGIDPAKIGEKFKGKAKVKGDSLKNDVIPADLKAGGVVIDRKNMGTREKRELFVHRAIARKKAGG